MGHLKICFQWYVYCDLPFFFDRLRVCQTPRPIVFLSFHFLSGIRFLMGCASTRWYEMDWVEESDGDRCDLDWATVMDGAFWVELTWGHTFHGSQSVINLLYMDGDGMTCTDKKFYGGRASSCGGEFMVTGGGQDFVLQWDYGFKVCPPDVFN